MHKHNFSVAILHKVLNKYEEIGSQIKYSLNFVHCFCEPAPDHVTQCDKDWRNWSLRLWNSEPVSMQKMLSILIWYIECTLIFYRALLRRQIEILLEYKQPDDGNGHIWTYELCAVSLLAMHKQRERIQNQKMQKKKCYC